MPFCVAGRAIPYCGLLWGPGWMYKAGLYVWEGEPK